MSADLPEVLQDTVLRLVPLRSVRLVQTAGVLQPTAGPSVGPEVIRVHAPVAGSNLPVALEGHLAPGERLDAWDRQVVENAASLGALIHELERRPRGARMASSVRAAADGAAPIVGSSPVMQALRERIERVARTDFTILIQGESGTGKELVARNIHELSHRSKGPFVAINCAALVETLLEAELFGIEERTATGVKGRRGKFEHADGGTLFLDEVSDLSLSAQAKLLRAIQDLAVERVGSCGLRRLDIRIVVATNRSLAPLVERGLFRQDLFYRLSGVEVRVPALRTRRDDILELARYFLERHRLVRRMVLSPAAADALRIYDWPGNVRELERLVEGIVALAESDRIEVDDLPPMIRSGYTEVLQPSLEAGHTMRAWGSRYARLVLDRSAQNKRQACRILGISYHTLQSYLRHAAEKQERETAPLSAWPDNIQAAVGPTRVHERPGRASQKAEIY
ncbi:MAG: sigma-54 interaction domain-containing protein [Vicinamibacterales bacterium]